MTASSITSKFPKIMGNRGCSVPKKANPMTRGRFRPWSSRRSGKNDHLVRTIRYPRLISRYEWTGRPYKRGNPGHADVEDLLWALERRGQGTLGKGDLGKGNRCSLDLLDPPDRRPLRFVERYRLDSFERQRPIPPEKRRRVVESKQGSSRFFASIVPRCRGGFRFSGEIRSRSMGFRSSADGFAASSAKGRR